MAGAPRRPDDEDGPVGFVQRGVRHAVQGAPQPARQGRVPVYEPLYHPRDFTLAVGRRPKPEEPSRLHTAGIRAALQIPRPLWRLLRKAKRRVRPVIGLRRAP